MFHAVHAHPLMLSHQVSHFFSIKNVSRNVCLMKTPPFCLKKRNHAISVMFDVICRLIWQRYPRSKLWTTSWPPSDPANAVSPIGSYCMLSWLHVETSPWLGLPIWVENLSPWPANWCAAMATHWWLLWMWRKLDTGAPRVAHQKMKWNEIYIYKGVIHRRCQRAGIFHDHFHSNIYPAPVIPETATLRRSCASQASNARPSTRQATSVTSWIALVDCPPRFAVLWTCCCGHKFCGIVCNWCIDWLIEKLTKHFLFQDGVVGIGTFLNNKIKNV